MPAQGTLLNPLFGITELNGSLCFESQSIITMGHPTEGDYPSAPMRPTYIVAATSMRSDALPHSNCLYAKILRFKTTVWRQFADVLRIILTIDFIIVKTSIL